MPTPKPIVGSSFSTHEYLGSSVLGDREYNYYDIVNNTTSNLFDESSGIKIEIDYVNRNLIFGQQTLDYSNNALIFLTNEISNDYNLNNSILGLHTKIENVTSETGDLSYKISQNSSIFDDMLTIQNGNMQSSKLELTQIQDETIVNEVEYNLSITKTDATGTTYDASLNYNQINNNDINFKRIIAGYNLDVSINEIKLYQLNKYVPGTHNILIAVERNLTTEVTHFTRDIDDITNINSLSESPLMEFGSTITGSAYQNMAYGFRLEMRFKDNNNDINSSPFLFYMANNTVNNPTTNFIDSSNAFYIIKRNASGRIGKQYILNMPGLSYVDILTPIISASNFETTYNTIIIDVSNNSVEISTSVNSDKIILGFLNNDQYTGLINNYIFNRIWVGYDLNLDVEIMKITMLI